MGLFKRSRRVSSKQHRQQQDEEQATRSKTEVKPLHSTANEYEYVPSRFGYDYAPPSLLPASYSEDSSSTVQQHLSSMLYDEDPILDLSGTNAGSMPSHNKSRIRQQYQSYYEEGRIPHISNTRDRHLNWHIQKPGSGKSHWRPSEREQRQRLSEEQKKRRAEKLRGFSNLHPIERDYEDRQPQSLQYPYHFRSHGGTLLGIEGIQWAPTQRQSRHSVGRENSVITSQKYQDRPDLYRNRAPQPDPIAHIAPESMGASTITTQPDFGMHGQKSNGRNNNTLATPNRQSHRHFRQDPPSRHQQSSHYPLPTPRVAPLQNHDDPPSRHQQSSHYPPPTPRVAPPQNHDNNTLNHRRSRNNDSRKLEERVAAVITAAASSSYPGMKSSTKQVGAPALIGMKSAKPQVSPNLYTARERKRSIERSYNDYLMQERGWVPTELVKANIVEVSKKNKIIAAKRTARNAQYSSSKEHSGVKTQPAPKAEEKWEPIAPVVPPTPPSKKKGLLKRLFQRRSKSSSSKQSTQASRKRSKKKQSRFQVDHPTKGSTHGVNPATSSNSASTRALSYSTGEGSGNQNAVTSRPYTNDRPNAGKIIFSESAASSSMTSSQGPSMAGTMTSSKLAFSPTDVVQHQSRLSSRANRRLRSCDSREVFRQPIPGTRGTSRTMMNSSNSHHSSENHPRIMTAAHSRQQSGQESKYVSASHRSATSTIRSAEGCAIDENVCDPWYIQKRASNVIIPGHHRRDHRGDDSSPPLAERPPASSRYFTFNCV